MKGNNLPKMTPLCTLVRGKRGNKQSGCAGIKPYQASLIRIPFVSYFEHNLCTTNESLGTFNPEFLWILAAERRLPSAAIYLSINFEPVLPHILLTSLCSVRGLYFQLAAKENRMCSL